MEKEGAKISAKFWIFENNSNFSLIKCEKTLLPALMFHSCVSHKERLFLFGGKMKNGEISNSLFVYQEKTGEWKLCENSRKPLPRYGHSCVVFGEKIFIIGGKKSNEQTDFEKTVDVFDIQSKEWSRVDFCGDIVPQQAFCGENLSRANSCLMIASRRKETEENTILEYLIQVKSTVVNTEFVFPLIRLSRSVLRLFLSFLSPEDVEILGRTCKQHFHLVSTCSKVWKGYLLELLKQRYTNPSQKMEKFEMEFNTKKNGNSFDLEQRAYFWKRVYVNEREGNTMRYYNPHPDTLALKFEDVKRHMHAKKGMKVYLHASPKVRLYPFMNMICYGYMSEENQVMKKTFYFGAGEERKPFQVELEIVDGINHIKMEDLCVILVFDFCDLDSWEFVEQIIMQKKIFLSGGLVVGINIDKNGDHEIDTMHVAELCVSNHLTYFEVAVQDRLNTKQILTETILNYGYFVLSLQKMKNTSRKNNCVLQ